MLRLLSTFPQRSMVFIVGCVALCAVFIFSMVCAYKFGKYQG